MGKPVLKPTGNDTFIIAPGYTGNDSGFDFVRELARSREQEAQGDFEDACNTRLRSFQRLVEIIPDEGETILEWEDENTGAAIATGYCSGIDHFLIGDWEMAAAIFEMILDIDPEDHMEATVPLAYTYIAMEEYDSFDDIINDVNDKYPDKSLLSLWSEYRQMGTLPAGEVIRLRTRFRPYYDEFVAAEHPINDAYLRDIRSESPSKGSLARELWLKTEHLWTLFPGFVETLKNT